MARTETNYRALNNRCPRCGHRLVMRPTPTTNFCTVVTGDPHNPEITTKCGCGRHRRP